MRQTTIPRRHVAPLPILVAVLGIACSGCSSDDEIERLAEMTLDEREALAAAGEREIEAQFLERFKTMTPEELTLDRTESAPQEPVVVRGVLHTSQADIFHPDKVNFLIVRFVTEDNIIGNEGRLELSLLGEGRFEYTTELEAPAVPGTYTTQIVYGGQHILTTTPFVVEEAE